MASRCVFCGYEGKLTREHVFPNWLHRVGLSTEAAPLLAGPLNRLGRELSPPTPYSTQVRAVWRACNEGWMKQLEDQVADPLTPWIRGEPAIVPEGAAPSMARWLQKTSLVSLLVSAAGGVGVPMTEYHELFARRAEGTPLPASHAWIGRYDGPSRSPFLWVTPLALVIEGLAEPDWPQGYAMTPPTQWVTGAQKGVVSHGDAVSDGDAFGSDQDFFDHAA